MESNRFRKIEKNRQGIVSNNLTSWVTLNLEGSDQTRRMKNVHKIKISSWITVENARVSGDNGICARSRSEINQFRQISRAFVC